METKLIPGTELWRIGSSSASWVSNATSPWWMSRATFDYMLTTAEKVAGDDHRLDRTFRRLSRMKLAMLPSWGGKADLVVRCVLRGRARIFNGRGTMVEDNRDNAHLRALGAFEIEQIFLPGLSFPDVAAADRLHLAFERLPDPRWQEHVEVRSFDAASYFAR